MERWYRNWLRRPPHSAKSPSFGTGDAAGPADIGYSPHSQELPNSKPEGRQVWFSPGQLAPCVSCSANTSIRLDGIPVCGHCAENLERGRGLQTTVERVSASSACYEPYLGR
jgi:hypothetical protein